MSGIPVSSGISMGILFDIHVFDKLREQSFLILGTGVEDFWQGYETFFHHFVGIPKF